MCAAKGKPWGRHMCLASAARAISSAPSHRYPVCRGPYPGSAACRARARCPEREANLETSGRHTLCASKATAPGGALPALKACMRSPADATPAAALPSLVPSTVLAVWMFQRTTYTPKAAASATTNSALPGARRGPQRGTFARRRQTQSVHVAAPVSSRYMRTCTLYRNQDWRGRALKLICKRTDSGKSGVQHSLAKDLDILVFRFVL